MPFSTVHQATAETSWRVLSLLRFGALRIYIVKRVLGMSESAFSHALRKLVDLQLVAEMQIGREKVAEMTPQGRILYSSVQALCFMLDGTDGTNSDDDSALARLNRQVSA